MDPMGDKCGLGEGEQPPTVPTSFGTSVSRALKGHLGRFDLKKSHGAPKSQHHVQ